ncbi:hypothetical protein [Bacillus pinisoli]|uniref:hypothetical protein n=1 Tax=Bacillus pinisoli TaxID=2901866 RepID=UPI001FF1130D|nr:hypothetical protein [Bacillus pinisoli]
MTNERGSSLLIVLLVSLVFMVLGLSIISASVGGSKRTAYRNAEIVSTQDAINTIEQVIAEFRVEMQNKEKYPLLDDEITSDFNPKIEEFINSMEQKYNGPQIQITDLTIAGRSYDYIKTDRYFTRVLELAVDANGRKVHQNIILSPTPSFLEYAVGSIGMDNNQGLFLNGSSYTYGNVYANDIYLRSIANYTDSIKQQEADTMFPAINGNVYVQRFWNGLNLEEYDTDDIRNLFYQQQAPTIKTEQKEFIDVNFRKSFAEKLNEITNTVTPITEEQIPAINDPNRNGKIESLINKYVSDSTHLARSKANLYQKLASVPDYVVYSSGNGLTLTEDITIPEDKWLVVHGDLTIFPFDNKDQPLTIDGNILVTGNVIIAGNEESINEKENDVVSFDSTIYSLGTSTILNTNIEGFNDKQLVLLSLGTLTITRINEFTDFEQHVLALEEATNIKPLKAFFYTDADAELYGVGSLFYINGGVFARDKLVINATRWNTTQLTDKKISVPDIVEQLNRPSRFNVLYDKNVIIDQLDALPRVERLQVVPDNLYIN